MRCKLFVLTKLSYKELDANGKWCGLFEFNECVSLTSIKKSSNLAQVSHVKRNVFLRGYKI